MTYLQKRFSFCSLSRIKEIFMRLKSIYLLFITLFTLFISCKKQGNSTAQENAKEVHQSQYQPMLDELKTTYAPDKRVALFNITIEEKGDKIVLSGETNLEEAKSQLLNRFKETGKEIEDQVQLLPAGDLGEKHYAIVNNSVANLRSQGKHSAELATQATLGMPLKVLKKDGDFYLVQTPDKYIAWVDHGGIFRVTESQWKAAEAAPKVIYIPPFGFAYKTTNAKSEPVADLVSGNMLQLQGESGDFYQVSFPDGRQAFVKKEDGQIYAKWLETLNPSSESLVSVSRQLIGLPYLWGGTSAKGVDCSGFTKTIYLLNGMVLPRDASQQVHAGELVDEEKDWDKLQAGDLLFFGRPATAESRERVVHVGMWIGNGEFIHASGRVRISSMFPSSPNYDEYNLNRYLRTKRILQTDMKEVMDLKQVSMTDF